MQLAVTEPTRTIHPPAALAHRRRRYHAQSLPLAALAATMCSMLRDVVPFSSAPALPFVTRSSSLRVTACHSVLRGVPYSSTLRPFVVPTGTATVEVPAAMQAAAHVDVAAAVRIADAFATVAKVASQPQPQHLSAHTGC